jgi:hypothetical protein
MLVKTSIIVNYSYMCHINTLSKVLRFKPDPIGIESPDPLPMCWSLSLGQDDTLLLLKTHTDLLGGGLGMESG